MKRKIPEKSKAEVDRESKEFLEKNKRELEVALLKYCKEFELDFEPPFSPEESTEIIKVAKQGEFAELLKMFPNYSHLTEDQKLNAKLIQKFALDVKQYSLHDRGKIMRGISKRLEGPSRLEANPELHKFKK